MDIRGLLAREERIWRSESRGRTDAPAKAVTSPFGRSISVIIPAHNEEAYLSRVLAALHRQTYPAREIVVVANGCTDATADVARRRCHRLVVLSQKSLCIARNLGARTATAELLVFLDADTVLERDALRLIVEKFSERDAAGTLKGRPDNRRAVYRLLYFLKNVSHGWLARNGSSGVIICWKKDFVRVGGFDERLEIRENSELIRRLKRIGCYRYISDATATTSMRRYERRGSGRVVWQWTRLWFQSLFADLRDRKYEVVR